MPSEVKRYVFVPAEGMTPACVEDTHGHEGEPSWYFGGDDDTAKMFCDAMNGLHQEHAAECERLRKALESIVNEIDYPPGTIEHTVGRVKFIAREALRPTQPEQTKTP